MGGSDAEAWHGIEATSGTRLIFVCDHASNRVPPAYGTLGLPPEAFGRHIAYDLGAAALTRALAGHFGAGAILARYTRLLIDPNRGLDDPTLIMALSDGAIIPGNHPLSAEERARRVAHYYQPYHDAITARIDSIIAAGAVPILVSIHSFTPTWRGYVRPWQVGILWNMDDRLARPLLTALQAEGDLVVGDNEPYSGELAGDTMDRHGTARGLPHALLEIRQDLIDTDTGVARWTERLARVIATAIGTL